MGKVILFSRVSTEKQDLIQQNNELYAEAKRNGYDDIILIEQKESAIKLDEDERIGIQKLKEAIESDNIECVIIYEISRLSRRPTVLYSVRDYLIEHQVNLICMKPYMKLLDPDGKMSQTASILFSLFGAMSESEMMIKKERMIRGRLAKREQGKYIGGNVQFGYTWDKKTNQICINEAERDTVIEIFERYLKGESRRQIAIDLMNRGKLRCETLGAAYVMLAKMLKRPEYGGAKGSTYPYPAIISQEMYNKVRQLADSRYTFRFRKQTTYYLQGLIYWKYNHTLMSPSKAIISYKGGDEILGKYLMINLDYVESLVWYFVVDFKKRISGTEKIKMLDNLIKEMMHINEKHRKIIQDRFDIESTIERINERIVKGKMSETQGDKLIEEQKTKMKDLDNAMNKNIEDRKQIEKQLDNMKNNIDDYDNLDEEQKNRIIRECVRKVEVENDGLSKRGRIIEIYMIDGTKHTIHMTKRNHDFITNIIYKDKETSLDDLKIIKRFSRK